MPHVLCSTWRSSLEQTAQRSTYPTVANREGASRQSAALLMAVAHQKAWLMAAEIGWRDRGWLKCDGGVASNSAATLYQRIGNEEQA